MDAKELLPLDIDIDEPCDPYMDAVAELEEAAHRLDLETWIVDKLRHCERELTVNIPLLRDDGSPATFTALRAQHAGWRGPTLGPMSFSRDAHTGAIRAAAMSSTMQAALLDIPVGGAAGAVICDAETLSERELHQLARDLVYGLRGMLGRHSDVIMPGAGCNEQIMSWMLDAHAQTLGRMERGAVTGLPPALSGLPATAAPVARGVLSLLRHVLATRRLHASHPANSRVLAGQRVVIQGFGATGSSIARVLHENGATITAVADKSGAVFNQPGIDVPSLQEHVARTGVVFGFSAADPCRNVDVLESDCDILITAAAERQITAAIANRIRASVICEATRSAITHTAESELLARGTIIVPAILATAGALVGSHLEWKAAAQISLPSAEELDRELERRVVNACEAVIGYSEARNVTPRRAATLIALDRIATELRLRR